MSYSPADKTRLLAEATNRMEAYFIACQDDETREPLRATDRETELEARQKATMTDDDAVALHNREGNLARSQRRAINAAGGLSAFSRILANKDE